MKYISLLFKAIISLFASSRVLYYQRKSAKQLLELSEDPRLRDVVLVYSQVIWDDVWQRPQEYSTRTARVRTVVYVSPVQVHDWLWRFKKEYRPVKIVNGTDGGLLIILSPLVKSGHFKFRGTQNYNSYIISCYLLDLLGKTKQIRALINTPFSFQLLRGMFYRTGRDQRLKRLVYDLIDDFTAFDWSPSFGKEYDRELFQMADAVLTGTYQLQKAHPGSTFVTCGVDFHAFAKLQDPPEDLAGLQCPVIGYFGTISERIDLELIAKICDEFPGASVVMVGPVHFQQSELPRRSNLHWLGLRPHDAIPAYAQSFDIGLIPFRLTPATMALHPVKTLEYLAAGVPVVSTAIPDVEQFYAGIVDVAHSHEEFIERVRFRLKNTHPARIQAGIEKARNASWQAMTDEMNAVLFAEQSEAMQASAAVHDSSTSTVPHT